MEAFGLKTADGRWIAQRLLIARSFRDRLRGLLKAGELPPDTALMLSPCASIHTFGMDFPIDVMFLNAQLRILRLVSHVVPWRVRWAPVGTKHVVELRAGTLDRFGLKIGSFVCVHPLGDRPPRTAALAKRTPCRAPNVQFSLRIPHECQHVRTSETRLCQGVLARPLERHSSLKVSRNR